MFLILAASKKTVNICIHGNTNKAEYRDKI